MPLTRLLLVMALSFILVASTALPAPPITLSRDPDDIRLYPGAQVVQHFHANPPSQNVSFTVDATPDEVASFYRQLLPPLGWSLQDTLYPYGWEVTGVWRNPAATAPTRRYFYLDVALGDHDETEGTLIYELWPQADRVPRYPGATQSTTSYAPYDPADGLPGWDQVTHYQVAAACDAVNRFYQTAMLADGWEPDSAAVLNPALAPACGPPLVFGYFRQRDSRWARVAITLTPDAGGPLAVEVRARGDEINPPPPDASK